MIKIGTLVEVKFLKEKKKKKERYPSRVAKGKKNCDWEDWVLQKIRQRFRLGTGGKKAHKKKKCENQDARMRAHLRKGKIINRIKREAFSEKKVPCMEKRQGKVELGGARTGKKKG